MTILFGLWCLYFSNIYAVRSSIAYLITLYSLKYVYEKKIFRFGLCIVLAFMMHRTAVLFVPVYVIYAFNWNVLEKLYIYISMFIVFLGAASQLIVRVLVGVFGETWEYRIQLYFTEGEQVGWFGIFNYALLYIIFVYAYHKWNKNNKKYLFLLNVYSIGLVPYVFGMLYGSYFITASYPFMMVSVLLLPIIIQHFKYVGLRAVATFILVIYFLLRLYSNINSYYDLYVPFKTIFSMHQ